MSRFLGPAERLAGLVVDSPRTNLVPNPSFEVNTTGWVGGSATLATTTAWAKYGSRSLELTSTSAASSSIADSTTPADRIPVTAAATYTLSAWVRHTVVGKTAGVRIYWFNNNTTGDVGTALSFSTTTGTVDTTTTGTRLSVTATAPAGATHAGIYVYFTNPGALGVVSYVDAVLFEKAGAAGSYFDGDTAGFVWVGTANASTSQAVVHAGGRWVTGVVDPSRPSDAATKSYTDAAVSLMPRVFNVAYASRPTSGLRVGDRLIDPTAGTDWVYRVIGGTGYWVPPPGANVGRFWQSVTQNLLDSTWVGITFDGVLDDVLGGKTGAASRYQPTVPGFYEFNGGVSFSSNATGNRQMAWALRGTRENGYFTTSAPNTTNALLAARPYRIYLNGSTDYVELHAWQNSGVVSPGLATVAGGSRSVMQVTYVGGPYPAQ